MIEMLGVLAIIGVLPAGGVWGYTAAMRTYRVNKLISDIEGMAANFYFTFTKLPNQAPTFFSSQQLYQLGIIPDALYQKDSAYLKSPSGFGSFYIDAYRGKVTSDRYQEGIGSTSYTVKAGPYQYIYMKIYVPKYACVKLFTHKWSNLPSNMIFVSNYNRNNGSALEPTTLSEAEHLCSSLDENGYAQMVITHREAHIIKNE